MARTGKSKIKGLELELYIDDEMAKSIIQALENRKGSIELHHLYFRHLHVEDLIHEGLKIDHLRLPIGRINKVKIKFAGPEKV